MWGKASSCGNSKSKSSIKVPQLACYSEDPGRQTRLQICFSSFTESCGLGVCGFRDCVFRRVAIWAPGSWQDKGLFWDFPIFMGFPLWALLWKQRLGFWVQVKRFDASAVVIFSGRVCFCLNDTVEAIWLWQPQSPSTLFVNLPLPPPSPLAPQHLKFNSS